MAIVRFGRHAIPIVNEDWHLPKGRAFLPGMDIGPGCPC